jgi:large subunit ribosomal protein L11e
LLESGLKIKEYELLRRNFSETECFGFNIKEHIDHGIQYDPSTSTYRVDFHVMLEPVGRGLAELLPLRCKQQPQFIYHDQAEHDN